MKRFGFIIAGIAASALVTSGCVSISKYTPPSATEEQPVVKIGTTGKQQPKVKVEVELLERPDLSRLKAPKTPDSEIAGNRGNFEGGVLLLRKDFAAGAGQPKAWWQGAPAGEAIESVGEKLPAHLPSETAKEVVITKYKVKKGQTLGDIAKDVYGSSKEWKKIYNANKNKIKDPNKIYAGQVLDVPRQESKAVKHLK